MKTLRIVVVLSLLAFTLQVGSQDTGSDVEWWGPTEEPGGFHIRVPVTVRNDFPEPVQNGLVMAQIDVTSGLVQAGWIHEASGTKERLSAFELDPHSVRVVEMRDLDPAEPGSRSGTLLAYDSSLPADDPRRYEVPSTHVEGFIHGDGGDAFHERTNPRLTVQWIVPEELAPREERYFVVYLDSLTNSPTDIPHPPADYRSTPGADALAGAFWSGPGTDLVGHVKTQGKAGNAMVLGLHPDTTVEVLIATDAGTFVPSSQSGPPFSIAEGESRQVFIGSTATTFRLVSDKPILALVDSEGFVPSTSGGFTGDEFLFSTTYPEGSLQDSLYIINRNPTDAPTTVQLQRLDAAGQPDGASRCITLSYEGSTPCTADGNGNFWPYTMGRRVDMDASCNAGMQPWTLGIQDGRNTYRATVTEGGPVAIQFDAVQGITQIPALGQGPVGTEFFSVLARQIFPGEPSNCSQSNTEAYPVFAAAGEATNLEVFSLERTNRLFPANGDEEPIGPFPTGPTLDGTTIDVQGQTDRPLRLRTDRPAWLMAGRTDDDSLAATPLRGPLGGTDAGRGFAGFGDAILYAPYPGTSVTMTTPGSSTSIHFDLAKERALPLAEAAGVNVRGLWYTLDADRPLIVLPTGASSGFLGGVPPLLTSTAHLESTAYKGYLVDIASPSGFNPMLVTTTPDEPAQYTLLVTNRGRGVNDDDLADDITVCPEDVPVGWTTRMDGADGCTTLTAVKSGETRSVTFQVEAPSDVPARAKAFIPVHATSENNPNVFDTIGTVTQVRSTFDVGMWFDAVKGKTEDSRVLFTPNDTAEYTLVVKNFGSVHNEVTLTFDAPGTGDINDGGWSILLDGQEEVRLTLPPQGTADDADTATLPLSIAPPDDITEGTLTTFVTARSSVGASTSSVAALTTLQGKSDLVLTPNNTLAWVGPGEEAVFRFTLENKGDGSAPVFFGLQDDEPPGWSKPQVYVPTPQGGRTPIDDFVILPGEKRDLLVALNSTPDALADDSDSIRFHLSTNTPGEEQEHFLKAVVLPVHDVRSSIVGSLPIRVDEQSSGVPITLRLTNEGNLDEILRAEVAALPPGWKVTLPEGLVVLRNTTDSAEPPTQSMEIHLDLPANVAQGEYNLSLRLVSEDRNATRIDIPIEVGAFADFTTAVPQRVDAQPGRPIDVPTTLTNTGNDAITFTVSEVDSDAWRLASTPSVRLPPGATTTLAVPWTVPSDTPDGATTHRFEFTAVSDDPSVATLRRTIEVEVDVGRPDLSVGEASRFEGAAGHVVVATLQNTGDRTAYDVTVHLRVGSETVDELTLAQMAPGRTYNATLLQPLGAAGTATILLDHEDSIVELDETNNAYVLETETGEKEAPAALAAPLLAFALAALRRRASSGAGPRRHQR